MSEKHYPYYGGSFDRIIFDKDGSVWVHEEESVKLREENVKLRELVIRADELMQGVLDNATDTVVVSQLPCCDTLLDNLEIYREGMRELGIEVEQ